MPIAGFPMPTSVIAKLTARPFPGLVMVYAAIAVAFLLLRVTFYAGIYNPDELIPIYVAEGMRLIGHLDPNFLNAPNMFPTPSFMTDQYNLYLYNVLASFIIDATGGDQQRQLFVLRAMNLPLQGTAIGFVVFALRNLGAHIVVQIVAALLLTVAPALVHDAHMARAESFLYLIFAVLFWTMTCPWPIRSRVALAGLLIGAGATIKVTFLLAGLVALPALWTNEWRELCRRVSLIAVCIVVAFAACAPYAVLHYDVFLRGVATLREQYSGSQPPHSLPVYSVVAQVEWVGRFFLILYGVMIPAAFAAPFVLRRRIPAALVGLWLFAVATFAYFAPQVVFFERNLCLGVLAAVPLFVWLLGEIRNRTAVTALLLLAVSPMTWFSIQIARASVFRFESVAWRHGPLAAGAQQRWEAANIHVPVNGSYGGEKIEPCDGAFIVADFNEPASRALIAKIEVAGYPVIARYTSPFTWLPASTLNTYLNSDMVYFSCTPRPR